MVSLSKKSTLSDHYLDRKHNFTMGIVPGFEIEGEFDMSQDHVDAITAPFSALLAGGYKDVAVALAKTIDLDAECGQDSWYAIAGLKTNSGLWDSRGKFILVQDAWELFGFDMYLLVMPDGDGGFKGFLMKRLY